MNIPNVRIESGLELRVRLKDNGVSLDWSSLQGVKALLYSVEQKAVAGAAEVAIDNENPQILIVKYPGSSPQYTGLAKLIVRCDYNGKQKTYDTAVANFVETTDEATGVIVLDDPTISVGISVEDVSTSLLDEAINAAFAAAEEAMSAAQQAKDEADKLPGIAADLQNAIDTAAATNSEIKSNESERLKSEQNRENSESARVAAEQARASAEEARKTAEDSRINKENQRINAESQRESNESEREARENQRIAEFSNMKSTISDRLSLVDQSLEGITQAENDRVTNEAERIAAEDQRMENESGRDMQEQTRQQQEQTRQQEFQMAEQSRQATFSASESARDTEFQSKESQRDAAMQTISQEAQKLTELGLEVSRINELTGGINEYLVGDASKFVSELYAEYDFSIYSAYGFQWQKAIKIGERYQNLIRFRIAATDSSDGKEHYALILSNFHDNESEAIEEFNSYDRKLVQIEDNVTHQKAFIVLKNLKHLEGNTGHANYSSVTSSAYDTKYSPIISAYLQIAKDNELANGILSNNTEIAKLKPEPFIDSDAAEYVSELYADKEVFSKYKTLQYNKAKIQSNGKYLSWIRFRYLENGVEHNLLFGNYNYHNTKEEAIDAFNSLSGVILESYDSTNDVRIECIFKNLTILPEGEKSFSFSLLGNSFDITNSPRIYTKHEIANVNERIDEFKASKYIKGNIDIFREIYPTSKDFVKFTSLQMNKAVLNGNGYSSWIRFRYVDEGVEHVMLFGTYMLYTTKEEAIDAFNSLEGHLIYLQSNSGDGELYAILKGLLDIEEGAYNYNISILSYCFDIENSLTISQYINNNKIVPPKEPRYYSASVLEQNRLDDELTDEEKANGAQMLRTDTIVWNQANLSVYIKDVDELGMKCFGNNQSAAQYTYCYWLDVEQEKGVYDFTPIWDKLAENATKGKRTILRIFPQLGSGGLTPKYNTYDGSRYRYPEYVKNYIVSEGQVTKVNSEGYSWLTVDYNLPSVREAFINLIYAFSREFNGHYNTTLSPNKVFKVDTKLKAGTQITFKAIANSSNVVSVNYGIFRMDGTAMGINKVDLSNLKGEATYIIPEDCSALRYTLTCNDNVSTCELAIESNKIIGGYCAKDLVLYFDYGLLGSWGEGSWLNVRFNSTIEFIKEYFSAVLNALPNHQVNFAVQIDPDNYKKNRLLAEVKELKNNFGYSGYNCDNVGTRWNTWFGDVPILEDGTNYLTLVNKWAERGDFFSGEFAFFKDTTNSGIGQGLWAHETFLRTKASHFRVHNLYIDGKEISKCAPSLYKRINNSLSMVGFRFVLTKYRSTRNSESVTLSWELSNIGISKCVFDIYKSYYKVINKEDGTFTEMPIDFDLRSLEPNSTEPLLFGLRNGHLFNDTINVPTSCRVELVVKDKIGLQNPLYLSNYGRQDDGGYILYEDYSPN